MDSTKDIAPSAPAPSSAGAPASPDEWLTAALGRNVVEPAPEETAQQPAADGTATTPKTFVFCTPHPWFGIAFDWRPLHKVLKSPATQGPFDADPAVHLKALCGAVEAERRRNGDKEVVATSLSLSTPWEMLPLDEAAQGMSRFSVAGITESDSNSAAAAKKYRFKFGPPGQRPARDAIARTITSVVGQLQEQNVKAVPFLGDIVILASSFDEALHRTAAVLKCLKAAGFAIEGGNCAFEPRPMTSCGSVGGGAFTTFTSLDTTTIGKDLCVEFLNDAFQQLIGDAYHWFALPPVGESRLAKMFDVFVDQVKACEEACPRALRGDGDAEGAQKMSDVTFRKSPRVIRGPQKWSSAELRVFWIRVVTASSGGLEQLVSLQWL